MSTTCTDVWSVAGWGNKKLLCQNSATYQSANGDSGGPTITLYGDGSVSATGQHWGRFSNGSTQWAWFSPMHQIITELYDNYGYAFFSPFVY